MWKSTSRIQPSGYKQMNVPKVMLSNGEDKNENLRAINQCLIRDFENNQKDRKYTLYLKFCTPVRCPTQLDISRGVDSKVSLD